MSKPVDTTSPMFRIIERQLILALTADLQEDRINPTPERGLGQQARLVLAEILGARGILTSAESAGKPAPDDL